MPCFDTLRHGCTEPQDGMKDETMSTTTISGSEPRHHAANIKQMLMDVSTHIQKDLGEVDDLQAKALFETTRETLNGLIKAFDDYENRAPAWR